jgi:hypothetical protein
MKTYLLTLGCFLGLAATTTTFAQTTTTPVVATAITNLTEYAGKYSFSSGSPLSTYAVTVKDGALHGDAGMGTYKLNKLDKADQFQSTSSYGSIITFTRDATTKAITGLTLAAQGQELTATKDK